MSDRLLAQYPDGVGLLRCDWCLRPVLTTTNAEILRGNLAAIIALALQWDDEPQIAQLAREALALLQAPPFPDGAP